MFFSITKSALEHRSTLLCGLAARKLLSGAGHLDALGVVDARLSLSLKLLKDVHGAVALSRLRAFVSDFLDLLLLNGASEILDYRRNMKAEKQDDRDDQADGAQTEANIFN